MKRNKSLYVLLLMTAMSTMVSCTSSGSTGTTDAAQTKAKEPQAEYKFPPEIQARIDAYGADLEVPEGLDEEDRIAYIENHVLTTPITAGELLALHPIHTLDPGKQHWEYISDVQWRKFRLMNRFMRMQFVALGDPTDELQWVEATQIILDTYADSLVITREQAIDSLLSAAGFLGCGTQAQINQCTYVMASVEYFQTLAAYKTFMEHMPENLQPLLYKEYTAWNKMNKARHNVYVDIVRAGSYYSALPMELEAKYAGYAKKRKQVLETETQILSAGKEYRLRHPVVKTADWNNYLKSLRYRCADDEALAIVDELDEAVRTWIAVRQKIAKHLPSSVGTSYDNVTADYHWVIVNDDESFPEEYI